MDVCRYKYIRISLLGWLVCQRTQSTPRVLVRPDTFFNVAGQGAFQHFFVNFSGNDARILMEKIQHCRSKLCEGQTERTICFS